jgi:hypothetical protein
MRASLIDGAGVRLARALAAAALLCAASVGTALGADPPDEPKPEPEPITLPSGVTTDAIVTIHFNEPADAGGDPIADAGVTLFVSRSGEIIQVFAGTTDADGTAVFEGVARATDGGDPVTGAATASTFGDLPGVDEGECVIVDGWSGWSADVDVAVATTIDIEAVADSIEICSGGGGTGGGGGELPDGVLADATLTVTVVDADDAPLAGASVSIMALLDESGEGFWKAYAETDADGRAIFETLPRADDGGPAVSWWIDAWAGTSTEIDGCVFATTWFGSTTLAATAGETAVELATEAGEAYGECADPGEGAPVLRGVVLGPDEAPLAGASGYLSMLRADGATWARYDITTADDGTFEVPIHAWGTADAPAMLVLEFRGEVTRTEPDGDCETAFGLLAAFSGEVALAEGGEPEPLSMTAADGEFGTVCAEEPPRSDTGAEGGAGGLPATDEASDQAAVLAGTLRLAVVLGAAAVALLAVLVAPRRVATSPITRRDRG